MSRRDFASLHAPAGASSPRGWSAVIGVVLVAGMAFAAGYFLGGFRNPDRNDRTPQLQAEIAKLQAALQESRHEAAELKKRLAAIREQAPELGELTFYHDLPAAPVEPTPLPSPATAPGAGSKVQARSTETPGIQARDPLAGIIEHEIRREQPAERSVYRVQAGSFRTRQEADELRRRLIREGIAATVREVSLDARGRWFRVYTNPVETRHEAETMRQRLLDRLGIHGLIVRAGDADG